MSPTTFNIQIHILQPSFIVAKNFVSHVTGFMVTCVRVQGSSPSDKGLSQ